MRIRTIVLASALLLGHMVSAAAQAHPCDQPAPPTVTIQSGAPHKVQFCAQQADNSEALLATVDGVSHDLVPVAAKSAPSATGQVLYESSVFIQVAKGPHELVVRLYNRNALTGQLQLGAATAPFAFSAVDDTPVPTAPRLLNVIR